MIARTRFFIVTLAAAFFAVLTLSLGFWQLDRAQQKMALQAKVDDKKSLPALENRSLVAIENIANDIHRPMIVQGRWLHAHTVYLDNRQMNARQGFYVLTPLLLSNSNEAIVVQRGWVARDFQDRGRLPELPRNDAQVRVQGRLAPPPAKLYEFAGPSQGAIRQNLDLAAFAQEIGQPLLPASLVQTAPTDEADAAALLRNWPAPNLGVDRHYGYAVQWFALSILIVFLYVWFQFIAPRRRRP